MNKWIDFENYSMGVGDSGYLVSRTKNGRASFALHERPLRTNQSNQPTLDGWCGETDNVSRFARGAWRVARMNKAGDRAQIVRLEGADLAEFLERDGYPELIPAA
jgi:hypothetical protein